MALENTSKGIMGIDAGIYQIEIATFVYPYLG